METKVEEVEEILNDKFYPDITNTISNYLYGDCDICKNKYETEFLLTGIDKKFYCLKCHKKCKYLRRCSICELFYSLNDNIYYCNVCLNICKVKCVNCYLNEDTDEIFNIHLYHYWLDGEIDTMMNSLFLP